MPNHLSHFAIHADDVERAKRFYASVFGWQFEPWGPSEFYLIHTGPAADPGVQGALQKRHTPLSGAGMRGFECTIGVDDLPGAMARIEVEGGQILSSPFDIDGVGRLVFFSDPEGNRVGLMHYVPGYLTRRRDGP